MTLTIKQVINLRSSHTVGPEGTISSEDFDAYEIMATNRLTALVGDRSFDADTTVQLKALLILDMLVSKSGRGEIIQETVTDSTWRIKGAATSSVFMDEVKTIIAEYDVNAATSYTSELTGNGICTEDVHLDHIIEGYYYHDKWGL